VVDEDARRGLVLAAEAREALKQGVETMTAALAVTLGPLGRTVAIDKLFSSDAPEMLTDAATIARRVIDLPNRYVNTGAMLIRHLAWNMREQVGDGSATAVVLARAMIRGGLRMAAAGANPMMIRRGIDTGVHSATEELRALAQPIDSQEVVTALAQAATGDSVLANLIAEIFDIVGTDGVIVIEDSPRRNVDREYVEGARWDSGLAAPEFVTNVARQEAAMKNPVIALADLEITSASQVVPVLELALREGAESLVLIAPAIQGEALGTLLLNQKKRELLIAPIRAPGLALSRLEILKDLAILTGATLIDKNAGRQLEDFRAEDFGRARQVIATRRQFTIVGAKGRQREIRQRILQLRAELDQPSPTALPDMLRRRLANLSGGIAILKLGAISEREREIKRRLAEDAVRSVRAALEEGTVPGGGAAYMACIPSLEALEEVTGNRDEAAGVRVVAEALAAPLQQIAVNAGYSGSTVAAQVKLCSPEYGFDALSGQTVDMREMRILDPTKVLRMALEMAGSTAAMVLTTEAIVLRDRKWPRAMTTKP